jgi:hypothetical protein
MQHADPFRRSLFTSRHRDVVQELLAIMPAQGMLRLREMVR